MSWKLLYLLPNLNVQGSFDADYFSIVPFNDSRLKRIIFANRTAAVLSKGFKSETGTRILPCALISREDAPSSVLNMNAVVDFRNMYAIACLISGNARAIVSGNITEPVYSDYFDFYPLTLNKNGRGLIIDTPAQLGTWPNPRRIYGSTYAHIFISNMVKARPDEVLLAKLSNQWKKRYITPARDSWNTRILFRSLEIAYQALLSPFRSSRLYEYGTYLSLWVSSFETLVQERIIKDVGFKDVLRLLDGFNTHNNELRKRRYWIDKRRNQRGSLILKLYLEIYHARNDFLHGNPVTAKSLFPFKKLSLPTLPMLAPVLYWAALSSFLPTVYRRSRVDRIGWAIKESFTEHDYHEALLSVIGRSQ